VLFSQEDVATFINNHFEPVWQSVRPVPLVRIDFGNGTKLTRTLHGNIASYVCTAQGQVLDILPGIYTRTTYLDRLKQFSLLAKYVNQPGEDRQSPLRAYHRGQAEALKKKHVPATLMLEPVAKAAIERNMKVVLMPGREATPDSAREAEAAMTGDRSKLDSPEDVANWHLLAKDTAINETVRRQQIHERLANSGPVRPEGVTKWLYKEVLHADLDDPYLGLGNVLFANYPFQDKVH
jgi:hypothetical protein